MDLDWHLMSISEEDTTSLQPPPLPRPNPVADARPRKKKARTLRESDWEPYKEMIIQLHHVEKRPLPEVRILMEQEFGFTAEIRQYRSRLSQWKLDKNIKPDEMKAIVRHRQQRDLIEMSKPALKFRVRGQEVEPHKIERWMKRHDIGESMIHAPSPVASTPSAVSYATMSEIGSPGIMYDVHSTVEYAPTTPRQRISSSPTTDRQLMDHATEFKNPLSGLHVVQVDDEHFFARWRYEFDMTTDSAWRDLWDVPWLMSVRSERTYGLVPERRTIVLCRHVVHVYLSVNSCTTALRDSDQPEDLDLIIYIYDNPHTSTTSVRFITEGTGTRALQHRPMGFDIVRAHGMLTCEFTQWEPWMTEFHYGLPRLLGWHLVIAESRLQRFTWPSNDDDVERAQFFVSRFGQGADGK